MLELRHLDETTLRLGYAGDVYNTAVYLSRVARELHVPLEVGFLTGVGNDTYSQAMRAAWRSEGVLDRSLVVQGKRPGMYAIQTDAAGERAFVYWRSDSAARSLLTGIDWIAEVDADLVYLSGITLQLLSADAHDALLRRLDALPAAQTTIAFDTNFRREGWSSAEEAARAIDAVVTRASIVFTTLADEETLYGRSTPERALESVARLGPAEIILKAGPNGVWLQSGDGRWHLPATPPAVVTDTTAAGDALAGGYLAARVAGSPPLEAVGIGMRVAAVVVAYPGALAPRDVVLIE
jgi:2-dehydro-3-deoxygluconokinase